MSEPNDVLLYFGEQVRELRREKGYSQEEFAFRCKLDRTYISDIERGKRNVSLLNLQNIADALAVPVAKLFLGFPSAISPAGGEQEEVYTVRDGYSITCGFTVTSEDVAASAIATSNQLEDLPFSLFQSIDLKSLSGMVGALFVSNLAKQVDAIVNPIEKGHPDIIPKSGKQASEEALRNYPEGLEIKCTVGNVSKGSLLQAGDKRLPNLSGLTWQAHHREVKSLLGLVIDFAGSRNKGKNFPIITAVFYSSELDSDDWGEISGTTGRNTKVTGMLTSGKQKMGNGWLIVFNGDGYKARYAKILAFKAEES